MKKKVVFWIEATINTLAAAIYQKKVLFWIAAIVITLSAAIYQRMTGPTYPKTFKITLNSHEIKGNLPRTATSGSNAQIELSNIPEGFSATLYYMRYPSNEGYTPEPFERKGSNLVAFLPSEPPAGKLSYYLQVGYGYNIVNILIDHPVIIRFKGEVPFYFLIPHIFFMFFAMLLSSLAGLFAFGKVESYKFWSWIAVIFLVLGGLIFGPIVQYYAFGEAWTGIPFGFDLTDNKTLIAFLAWAFALLINRKKERPAFIIGAAVVLLVIFSIPHSAMGSELNYSSGKVVTGLINVIHFL